MRKIYSILLAAFALSAVSCQEEIVDSTVEVPVKEVMTITAGFDTETKTVLHTNGVSSLWHENDKVSVFDTKVGDNNRCFSIVKEEGDEFPKATATFATAEEFTMPGDQTQDQALIVALYPYQETAYCDFFDPQDDVNDITDITIPVEQVAVADGFDASAAFALATGKYTERNNLRFKNLYSLLKINVLEEGVKKIEVVLETEGFIAGEAQIVLTPGVDENERPVFNGGVLTATGSKSVTLTCEAGFEVGKIYSVAIAPVTYTNVKVYLDDQLAKDTTPATAKTLEPNTFYNIRDLKKLATRGLAFDEATYNVLLGNDFNAPELKGEKEGVVYTSSNVEVATVDAATGAVIVLAEGETVITASAPQTTALLAGEASYTLVVGEKAARNLVFSAGTAEATLGAGFTAPTLDGEKAGVVYSSSDTAVATVDAETGEVTLVAVGETTITASAEENETHLEGSASYVLTVNPAPKVERGLAFNPTSVTVTYGETITKPELIGEVAGVVYSSSNTAVATVDPETGVLTYGNTAGETTITASAPETETYLAGEASYKFIVTKAERNLAFKQTVAKAFNDKDFTAPQLTGVTDDVTYESTNPDVATVDASGKISLVAAGETTIKVSGKETDTHLEGVANYTLHVYITSTFGVIGVDGDWDNDIVLYKTGKDNFFVAYGVEFKNTESQFKIRKITSWEDPACNFGTTGTAKKSPNSVVGVYTHGDSGQIKVSAGTYDIYFDRLAGQVYIMEAGKSYTEATKPSKPNYNYGLVGSFTSWNSNLDMNYSGDGVWTLVRKFTKTEQWKIRKDSDWNTACNSVWVGWELKTDVGSDKNLQMNEDGEYIVVFIEKDAKDGNSLITILKKYSE